MIVVESATKEGFAREILSFKTFDSLGQYIYFITSRLQPITWVKVCQ